MYNMLPENAMTVVTTERRGERGQKRDECCLKDSKEQVHLLSQGQRHRSLRHLGRGVAQGRTTIRLNCFKSYSYSVGSCCPRLSKRLIAYMYYDRIIKIKGGRYWVLKSTV